MQCAAGSGSRLEAFASSNIPGCVLSGKGGAGLAILRLSGMELRYARLLAFLDRHIGAGAAD